MTAPAIVHVPAAAPDAALVDELLALFGQGHVHAAGALAQTLTREFPEYGFGWKALSITLQLQGQAAAALSAMLEAVRLLPNDAEAHNNLGLVLVGLQRPAEAETVLRRALALAPAYTEAHNNLAIAQLDQGHLSAALASLQRALTQKPDYIKAHNNMGIVLQAQSRMADAIAAYRRALALHPLYADAHSNLLFCLTQVERAGSDTLMAEYASYAERFEAPVRSQWPLHANSRDPERPLRVGIVSGDLRDHPVAAFLEPVLAVLARSPALTLLAYSNHVAEDQVSARLRGLFAGWTGIAGWDDGVLAARIGADAIDILIDLSGHTAHNRLPVFARKPAPVQVSWIGHPGSTGLAAMDYYLTDPFMLPPGQFDAQFSEKLVHLPAIDNGYLTFGSFNRPSKLSRPVVALWSRVLRAVPSARMLLASMAGDGDNEELAALFALNGVARRRLDFYPRTDMATYLALHHQVDVCLDTFPYAGGTTTLHALYMGVPTLTLAGDTPAGRQGASILRHVGMDAFVADDEAQFAAIGAALPADLGQLAAVRASLRARFGMPGTAELDGVGQGVELALRAMWRRWCQGLPPAPLQISLPPP